MTAVDIPWTLGETPASVAVDDDLLVDLVLEGQAYRLIAQQAINALHHLHCTHEQLRRAHERIKDEYRSFRERILRDAGVTE
jgi:hypothetical protein